MSDSTDDKAGEKPRDPTKRCRICAHDMPAAARKCNECESFQDWRGTFNPNATILSLLIALVSTTVAAIPVLKSAAIRDDSDIFLQLLRPEPNSIRLVAVNRGTRPGFVGEGSLRGAIGRGYLTPDGNVQATLIQPGQFVQIVYGLELENLQPLDDTTLRQNCIATFTVINFRSNTSQARIEAPCADFLSQLPD